MGEKRDDESDVAYQWRLWAETAKVEGIESRKAHLAWQAAIRAMKEQDFASSWERALEEIRKEVEK